MVQINFARKEVNCKIVFYGPGMSGKTTNLEIVHQKTPDANKGELTSISTDGDRTLFFDFMPLDLGTVAGMRTKFQLYTVPGQIYYNSTRKLVLQGVDGIIFVADSDPDKIGENIESYQNLLENLAEHGKDPAELPHVIQYNKRDLPNAMSIEDLDKAVNRYGVPTFQAVANTGEGVFPTLKTVAGMVLESLDRLGQSRQSALVGSAPQAVTVGATQATARPSAQAPNTVEWVAPQHDSLDSEPPGQHHRQTRAGGPGPACPSVASRPGHGTGPSGRSAAHPRQGGLRRTGRGRRQPRGGRPPRIRPAAPRPARQRRGRMTPAQQVEKKRGVNLMVAGTVVLAVAIAGLVYFVMSPGF